MHVLLSQNFLATTFCCVLTKHFSFSFFLADNKSSVLGIFFQVKIFIICEQKAFSAVVQLNYESQR